MTAIGQACLMRLDSIAVSLFGNMSGWKRKYKSQIHIVLIRWQHPNDYETRLRDEMRGLFLGGVAVIVVYKKCGNGKYITLVVGNDINCCLDVSRLDKPQH